MGAFALTDAIPFKALALATYRSLTRIFSPLVARRLKRNWSPDLRSKNRPAMMPHIWPHCATAERVEICLPDGQAPRSQFVLAGIGAGSIRSSPVPRGWAIARVVSPDLPNKERLLTPSERDHHKLPRARVADYA